jgi:formylglycine-generating enzyme required for sulfatase activity
MRYDSVQEPARQQVERFVRRFEPSYRDLAYYAALPLVLTPELVHYLRNRFLPRVHWVAEADLLLSDLCHPVGYEQYAIDPAVRAYLISEQMKTKRGRDQMQAVARLLLSYVRQLAQANPDILRQQELDQQQMAAMVYLDDQRESVVRQLVERYEACAAAGKLSAEQVQKIQAELDGLVRMTQEMARQLGDYPALVDYAKLLRRLLDEPETVNSAELAQRFAVAPGMELAVPSVLVAGATAQGDAGDAQWQAFEYEAVTVGFDEDVEEGDDSGVEVFEFDMAALIMPRRKGQTLEIDQRRGQAWQFVEQLADEVTLEMVAIRTGEFVMGSPPEEAERRESEGPQHRVTVPEFYMGKHPITQAQWRVVAGLPQVECQLDPDPSRFKGDDRPVEQVSWDDAVEFCARLSKLTDRQYRLPTEAEWEYACRAGSTTAFHFGETITSDVANYDGDYAYGSGPKGVYREETTSIGTFPANAFGLYDMHGNVWEWCADHWHKNYDGAPIDGSAWLSDEKDAGRLLRGGSWYSFPRYCRSAVRYNNSRAHRFSSVGFRVSCSAARILP